MRKDILLIRFGVILSLHSCGKFLKNDQPVKVCRPKDIAIAECLVEEFEKFPNRLMLEYQRNYCNNLYRIDMCYYR